MGNLFTNMFEPAPGGMSSLGLFEAKNKEKVKKIYIFCFPMTRLKINFSFYSWETITEARSGITVVFRVKKENKEIWLTDGNECEYTAVQCWNLIRTIIFIYWSEWIASEIQNRHSTMRRNKRGVIINIGNYKSPLLLNCQDPGDAVAENPFPPQKITNSL